MFVISRCDFVEPRICWSGNKTTSWSEHCTRRFVLWMFWDRISASGTQPSWFQPPKYLCSACSRVLSSGLGTSLSVSSETERVHTLCEAVYYLWMDNRTGRVQDRTFIFELIPQAQESYLRQMGSLPFHTWGAAEGSWEETTQAYIPPGYSAVWSKPQNIPFPEVSSASSKDVSAPSTSCPNLQWGGACVHDGQGEMPSVVPASTSAFTGWDLKISCVSPYHPLFKVTLS